MAARPAAGHVPLRSPGMYNARGAGTRARGPDLGLPLAARQIRGGVQHGDDALARVLGESECGGCRNHPPDPTKACALVSALKSGVHRGPVFVCHEMQLTPDRSDLLVNFVASKCSFHPPQKSDHDSGAQRGSPSVKGALVSTSSQLPFASCRACRGKGGERA